MNDLFAIFRNDSAKTGKDRAQYRRVKKAVRRMDAKIAKD